MNRLRPIRDESGATLIEVTMGLATGVIVMFALTTMLISTMHTSARISARIDANRNARLTITRVTEQLRSSCVAPRVAPIKGGSTGTSLVFIHQTGSAAVLNPVESRIELVDGTLTQYDYAMTGGSMPNWEFSETATSVRQLATGISPIAPSTAIFTYLGYSGKAINLALPVAPLSDLDAARTVAVRVSFSAAPRQAAVTDSGSGAQVRDTALLRLTTLAFNKETDEPCL